MRKELGILGEKLALKTIKSMGYKVLTTNYRCPLGEIDIIAREKNCLVFIEVRSRKSAKFGLPQETVNKHKQRKIRQVAQYYIVENSLHTLNCRFDVIGIVWNTGDESRIEVIKDAF